MAHKLDIWETLRAIDRCDKNFYTNLSDDAKKGFAPPVVLRWASTVRNGPFAEYYLWLINERANINYHDIWEHPELQYKLLAASGAGSQQKHDWIGLPKQKKKNDKVSLFLLRFWPSANDTELDILLGQFTDETFYEFVESSGASPEDAKEVIEAYDRNNGKTVKTKKPKGSGKKRA